jgi:quinone-modifying oxidoreductase subunit QmoC
VIFFTHHLGDTTMVVHGEEIQVEGLIRSWKMIPMLAVDVIFILTGLFAVTVFAVGIARFWKDLDAQRTRQMGVIPAAIAVAKEIVTHSNFKECGTNQERYLGHLGIFYGFVALFIVTSCIFAGVYFIGPLLHVDLGTPWSLWNPVKILANLGAIALLVGLFLVIRERLRRDEEESASSYYDWFLVGLVTAMAVSGFLAEICRLLGIGFLFYLLYFIHLVCVWSLFAYAPFSKIAHIAYRTVALIHAKACGRYLMRKSPVIMVSDAVAAVVPAEEEKGVEAA